MATFKETGNNKYFEDVEKKEPSYILVGMQTSISTIENSVEIPLKTGHSTAIQPSNPTAGHTH